MQTKKTLLFVGVGVLLHKANGIAAQQLQNVKTSVID